MTPNEPETAVPNNADPATPRTGPTGPRTPSGKTRCRFNAVSHGLTRRVLLFEGDEADHYLDHCSDIHNHYNPVGPIEEALVRQIADGIYRLDRASAIEHGIFAFTLGDKREATRMERATAPAQTWLDEAKNLSLLTLYVKRIENKLTANKSELERLQAIRWQKEKEREKAAAELAAAELRTAQPQPEPHAESHLNPESDFDAESVFSSGPAAGSPIAIDEEILAFIARGLAKTRSDGAQKDIEPEAA